MKSPEAKIIGNQASFSPPLAELEMYNVSGQPEITEHSFDRYLKDKEQDAAILKQALMETAPEKKEKNIPKPELEQVKRGLENPDPEVQKIWAAKIWDISEDEERSHLQKKIFENIQEGLKNSSAEKQKIFIQMIGYVETEAERISLQRLILENISQGLKSFNPKEQKAWAEMIGYAPEKERRVLQERVLENIRQVLRGMDAEKQKKFVPMIDHVPEEEKNSLAELIIEKGLGQELIKPALYEEKEPDNQHFSRQKFDKTGSETVLLGGELKDKTIIRTLKPKTFIAWQKLFEDSKLWENAGFDYVPIEPISSFKLNKNGLVDVYSGVLDLSLQSWTSRGIGTFNSALQEQQKKILKVLDGLNIKHGHPHDNNFCLRFFRGENGEPDFTKTPRLYLIDFDQAVSPE
jgi:hypothetical protein